MLFIYLLSSMNQKKKKACRWQRGSSQLNWSVLFSVLNVMKNTWTTELEEMSNYTLVIVSETFIPWRARWCFTFPFSLSFSPKQLQIYHYPVTTSEVLFSSPHFFLPSDWKSSEWTLFIALGCFLMIKLFGIIHPANFFFFECSITRLNLFAIGKWCDHIFLF